MNISMDYLIAQLLGIIFYIITLVVYYRAKKEYVGGKIAAAINLIMIFLAILLLSDFVDYFFILILPLAQDTILISKILLKMFAICVLFFGGLRFFVTKPVASDIVHQTAPLKEVKVEYERALPAAPERDGVSTVELKDVSRVMPTLGRYEIIEQIGRGAMGIVYKGRDPKLHRLTAIKTIRFIDEFDEDQAEKIKEQFYREAELVAKLSHSNIVTIYDVGEDLDLSYLAMEYLDGEGLDKYTKAGNLLPIRKCIDIMSQVCDALEYAHKHDIVHRDIKPENIMLLKDGQVKVTDFGIARLVAGSKTRTGIIKGTPYYMSPEQTKGTKIAGPSDIFSLGVVFYQLLTGRLPFTGDSLATITYQITTVDPEPPTKYNTKINKATVAILNRALEKSLEKRYQTAKQMGDQLRLLIQSLEADKEEAGEEDVEIEDSIPGIEADEFSYAAVSEIEQEQEEDFDFSDLEQVLEADKETEEEADAKPQYKRSLIEATIYKHPHRDATIEKRYPGVGKKIEPETKFKPEVEAEGRIQGRAKLIDSLIKFKTPIIVSGILFIVLSGAFYYFWKSRFSGDTLIKGPGKATSQLHIKKKVEDQKEQERLAKIEEEKQKEQERLARIEEEKRKEQERLAKIEEEKQKEQERIAKIEEEERKEQERLAKIEEEKRKEQERLAKIEKDRIDALKLKEIKKIDEIMSSAEESMKLKKYLEAKNSYENALKIIEGSNFNEDKLFLEHRREIEKALMNKDIIYGVKGYVKFRNKWMTPDEYENILYQEGFVKYKGKFIKHLELKNIIKQLTHPEVQSFLTSKYSDQNIHKKQIKFHKLALKQNNNLFSHFTVFYKWEVWTFSEIGEGTCPIDIFYEVEKDKWRITKGCE
ncbi:MAG: serine/threonine-protein kinase [Desulfobacterales bacterium]